MVIFAGLVFFGCDLIRHADLRLTRAFGWDNPGELPEPHPAPPFWNGGRIRTHPSDKPL